MKNILCLLCIGLNLGCSQQYKEASKNTPTVVNNQKEKQYLIQDLQQLSIIDTSEQYEAIVREILKERESLQSKNLTYDSLSVLFKASLLHKIIPFWEGTPWSFEGHTAHPNKGQIACGYFVSTTLRDLGLHLNRYKLAQQSPINEALSLAIHSQVKTFYDTSTVQTIARMKKELKEGIHFIGFNQSHVGYLLLEDSALYIIHSNYLNGAGVMIEPAAQSDVFSSYYRFFITELSTNPYLLDCWVNNTAIEIVREKNK